jgi:hypothetical protein
MPGRDGTGPQGRGAATGWGAGGCAGYRTSGAAGIGNPGEVVAGRPRGWGRGFGMGFCGGRRGVAWGFGRGRGWQPRFFAAAPRWGFGGFARTQAGGDAGQEKEFLAREAEALESELHSVQARLARLNESEPQAD